MREIKTLEEFNELKDRGLGYLLITDPANGNKIHSATCSHVKEEYFQRKVIDEQCKNGNYYLIDDIEGVMRDHNAELCMRCMK